VPVDEDHAEPGQRLAAPASRRTGRVGTTLDVHVEAEPLALACEHRLDLGLGACAFRDSPGQSLTLTATVSMSSGPVSGLVEFYDGGTLIGSASIASRHASLTTSWQIAGSKPVTALYVGSVSAPPARSNVLVQAVTGAAWKNRSTTLGLVASPNPATLGTTVVLTATVDGSTSTVPSGRVLFMIDGLVVGNPLGESLTPLSGSDSRATLSVPGLAHGRHKVTATYLGNSTYRGSTGAVVETIN
jgi:hypothetical protein